MKMFYFSRLTQRFVFLWLHVSWNSLYGHRKGKIIYISERYESED